MAELFTHVVVGYILATMLSWRLSWITPPLVTVAMVGAVIPDLNRMELLISEVTIQTTLGIPFSWMSFHRVGGTLVVIAMGALLVPARLRRAVLAMALLGAGSHYLLDFFLYNPSGLASPLFWPLTGARFQIEGFYLSTDWWPAVVSTIVGVSIWYVDRHQSPTSN